MPIPGERIPIVFFSSLPKGTLPLVVERESKETVEQFKNAPKVTESLDKSFNSSPS